MFKLYGGTAVSCAHEESKDDPQAQGHCSRRVLMSYYRDLRDHVVALDKAGLLVKIDEQINKDI